MKLNLLPAKSGRSSSGGGGSMWVGVAGGLVLIALGFAVGVGLWLVSEGQLKTARDEALALQQPAADAVATARAAEDQIASAAVIVTNQQLAAEMIAHNDDYIDLYNKVRRYIPSYYRVTSLTAQPLGTTSSVTIVGQLQTFTQYADLAIALWKIPGVINVTRGGYVLNDQFVPNLTEIDQVGRPIERDETPLPSDPLERMEALIARAAAEPQGFQNVGGFGSTDDTVARGAMPGWSTVTMNVVINDDIRTPDPRATLAANTAPATVGTTGAGFGTSPGGVPGAPLSPGGGRGPAGPVGRDDD